MGNGAKPQAQRGGHNDADRAVRFLAVKAAIFILVPLLAALAAVMVMLK